MIPRRKIHRRDGAQRADQPQEPLHIRQTLRRLMRGGAQAFDRINPLIPDQLSEQKLRAFLMRSILYFFQRFFVSAFTSSVAQANVKW